MWSGRYRFGISGEKQEVSMGDLVICNAVKASY